MFDGQSLIYSPVTGASWPDLFMAPRLADAESFRVARSGTTYAQRAATAADRVDPLLAPGDRQVRLVSDGCQSDLLAGLTSAQVLAAMDAYFDARRAVAPDLWVAVPTVPEATAAWGWTPEIEAQRLALNDALRADPAAAGADAVVDVAAAPELQDPTDLEWFSDGLHYTAAAAEVAAARWTAAFPA